jgi:hypothetical protein
LLSKPGRHTGPNGRLSFSAALRCDVHHGRQPSRKARRQYKAKRETPSLSTQDLPSSLRPFSSVKSQAAVLFARSTHCAYGFLISDTRALYSVRLRRRLLPVSGLRRTAARPTLTPLLNRLVISSQLAKITCPTGRQYIDNRFERPSASPGP